MLELQKLDLVNHRHALSEFQKDAEELLSTMKTSGQPLVLTVKGKPKAVVLTAEAFQEIWERLAMLESLEGIRRGLDCFERGEGRPVEELIKEFREKHGVPRQGHAARRS